MRKLSFVIPCYGSEKTIQSVINDIISTVKEKDDYEIICINDCSKDNVYDVLCDIAKTNKKVKVISFSKNFGQHNALMCGFRHVSGDIVICLDDDGQTDPKQCYKLIDALNNKIDVVIAKYPTKHHNLFRNFGTLMNKRMSEWLCDFPKEIDATSYSASKRFIIDEMVNYTRPFTFLGGLFVRTTQNMTNVEIEHKDRLFGKSGYTFVKLISLWFNGFTAFSVKPLRIASFIGLFTSFVGFIYGIYIIIRKLIEPTRLIGYSSIMCVILFIGGMIMMILGLMGEYIGRIYICLNNSPQYVIKNKINFD